MYGTGPSEAPAAPVPADVEWAGEQQQPSFLLDGALLVTGEVDRTTDFEHRFLIHQAFRGGTWAPDPLILDDQALIANVAGKGLVALTGCGHAGIVNICRYAQRLTGEARLHPAGAGTRTGLRVDLGPWSLGPGHATLT